MVVKYLNQNYSKLKREHQHRGELFTDPEFPPTNASLFISGKNDKEIEWKRPGVSSRNFCMIYPSTCKQWSSSTDKPSNAMCISSENLVQKLCSNSILPNFRGKSSLICSMVIRMTTFAEYAEYQKLLCV